MLNLIQPAVGSELGVDTELCPLLSVDVFFTFRRCFENCTAITYCNEGLIDATDVAVHLGFLHILYLKSTKR